MSTSRKKNQKSTPTRGATALNSSFTRKPKNSSSDSSEENTDTGSSTFVRPTATGSRPDKNSEADSTFVRPTKTDDKQEETNTESRPTGRIDHPTTKYDYIEQMGGDATAPNATDNSDVVIEYTLKVVTPGPNAEKVADLVLGASWRRRNLNPNGTYSCTFKQTKANEAFEMARGAVALGAQVEFKKRILIEVTII